VDNIDIEPATRRAKGFNMRIIYWSRRRKLDIEEETGAKYTDFKSVLREVDFVSLHLALTAETKNIMGENEMRLMKPTTFLINTARGPLINEDALYRCLRDRVIAGAAVDSYSDEPPQDSSLLSLDNIITTPHMGAYTYEALRNMGMTSVENIIDALEGRKPRYVVNPEVYQS